MILKTGLIAILIFLCVSWAAAEVVMKVTGPQEITFYQNGKEVAKQGVDSKTKATKMEGVIPDGIVKTYYPSGKPQAEITYKDSKKNGVLKVFYEKGKLQEETMLKNDLREGPSKIYYENGKPAQEVNYKAGKLSGNCRAYFENGHLQQEANYINGNPDGPAKKYFEDGQLQEDMIYHEGKMIKSKKYNIKGELIYEKGVVAEQQK